MIALSKSRFKQGLECPNKLYFSNNKEVYYNVKNNDPFLQALASGGFQVEEYARLQYPGGVLIEDPQDRKIYDYQDLADQTSELLKQENVVIYEAAFYIDDLFIRTDILVKKGTHIQLIEVKAKSLDPRENYNFVRKSKKIVSSWKPYLFDLAFQTYVTQRCLPTYKITPYLCLVDKTKSATVDGLNQFFRVKKDPNNRTGVTVKVDSISQLGENILHQENLSEVISKIHNGEYTYYDNLNFHEALKLLSEIRTKNYYPNWPARFSACKKCEFKKDEKKPYLKSGFENCFKRKLNWTEDDFKAPNAFEIWDFRRWKHLIDNQILKLEDISDAAFGDITDNSSKIGRVDRQLIQKYKSLENESTPYLLKDSLKSEMENWKYPLNFIDFEASTVALPFYSGQKPYEKVVFQFSHHVYYEDGTIIHENEYINVTAGDFPNFEFVRQLKNALSANNGTVFQYSPYENSTLNQVKVQLEASDESDKAALINFIKTLTTQPTYKDYKGEIWSPSRKMIDLCEVIKAYYYNPHTKGSNSIKAVLPAIFESSLFIRDKYSKSISDINLTSKNFSPNHIWLNFENEKVIDPYKTLGKPFEEWDTTMERITEMDEINNGGAALTAYGLTQYTNMSNTERDSLKASLLKYCELDTLAMVMVFEHLKKLCEK